MEKFEIIPGRDTPGLTDVMHNESPRCKLLVSDLNINDAYEGDPEYPVKIFDFVDPTDGHYYWAEVTIVKMFESGSYERLIEDCWKWWLALEIRKRNMERFSDD
ncbi:hypothetical protein [Agriterribacter sp.]|uniref:hypothetical protein n=1 Tax=Agriterribacter sp. TaxID=2821509 RepID=UPI002B9FF992|nr:hypothetical protein [Agriterribacter sp.]HTN09225.1 hypothetical protein [Agriterribacter sp.]